MVPAGRVTARLLFRGRALIVRAPSWLRPLLVGVACCSPYQLPPSSPRVAELPAQISEAGLYTDPELTRLAADLQAFRPSFELWSDGATKRRWIRLPPGAHIDSSSMDAWSFPAGTQLWKEFWVQGRRIETRLLTRVATGTDGWTGVAYVWNAAQTEAVARPEGAPNALGTTHDVPPAGACMACHGGRAERALGFSAIQLAHARTSPDELTLDGLVERGLLSAPPRAPIRVPGSPDEVAALGYLHVNCGSCHNGARPDEARYFKPPAGLDLWLQVGALARVDATPTYRTSLGEYVVPGAPERSKLLWRFENGCWSYRRMPPLATAVLDPTGQRVLERWIRDLPRPR